MKKAFWVILATVIVLSLCVATVVAAGPGGRRGFVDADGDGVCDNRGMCAFSDTDGDGVCDACGADHRCGGNFADADGDGVCDNYASGQGRGGHGCGFRGGRGNGHGCGRSTW